MKYFHFSADMKICGAHYRIGGDASFIIIGDICLKFELLTRRHPHGVRYAILQQERRSENKQFIV